MFPKQSSKEINAFMNINFKNAMVTQEMGRVSLKDKSNGQNMTLSFMLLLYANWLKLQLFDCKV